MTRKIQIKYSDDNNDIFSRTISYINPNIADSIATTFVNQTILLTDNTLISSNVIDTRELNFTGGE